MDKRTCSVDGCDKPLAARGWCNGHFERWRLTGDVRADIPLRSLSRPSPPGTRCAVDDCGSLLAGGARGWCSKHYGRWKAHGDPLAVKYIIGDDRTRIESYIDRSGGPDACHPWTGGQWTDGYGCIEVGGHAKGAHVAVWELENGPTAPGIELDHECHNAAVRAGTCRPGKCPHRLCCNIAHIIPRTKSEHFDATVPWDRGYLRHAVLTEPQVREMRELLKNTSGRSQITEIAGRYGISVRHAYRIKAGAAWGWLAA